MCVVKFRNISRYIKTNTRCSFLDLKAYFVVGTFAQQGFTFTKVTPLISCATASGSVAFLSDQVMLCLGT